MRMPNYKLASIPVLTHVFTTYNDMSYSNDEFEAAIDAAAMYLRFEGIELSSELLAWVLIDIATGDRYASDNLFDTLELLPNIRPHLFERAP